MGSGNVSRWGVLGAALFLGACRAESPRPANAAQPENSPPAKVSKLAPAAATPVAATDTEVHGALRTVEGQEILEVWGTPREMGFAHGALLRERIIEVLDGYALDVITPAQLEMAGAVYGKVAHIAERRREEAEGIVEGMRSRGGARLERLDRDLRGTDLLVLNAVTDLLSIGCSSVSAWGNSTASIEGLEGGPIVVRNLDWTDDPDLLRNQLLIVYRPSEPAFQPVVSVAFAGYIGCLSCLNESGVTALFNMGYGDGAAELSTAAAGFAPANLLLRDVMEQRDVDGDGQSSAADVEAGARAAKHAGSYILHVLGGGADPGARILEIEADGVHARTPSAATPLGETMLAATNHLRGKEGPQACRRYDRIERAVTTSKQRVERDALWDLGRRLRLPEVVHTMQIEPGNRTLRVWFRGPEDDARAESDGVLHRWETLLSVPSGQ